MHFLARNWQQIKNADQVITVSKIIFKNKECVSDGTGWAIQMSIDHHKEIFVFDQVQNAWFERSYSDSKFCILGSCPKITSLNFACIGIRIITINGINAIENLYINSINKV